MVQRPRLREVRGSEVVEGLLVVVVACGLMAGRDVVEEAELVRNPLYLVCACRGDGGWVGVGIGGWVGMVA